MQLGLFALQRRHGAALPFCTAEISADRAAMLQPLKLPFKDFSVPVAPQGCRTHAACPRAGLAPSEGLLFCKAGLQAPKSVFAQGLSRDHINHRRRGRHSRARRPTEVNGYSWKALMGSAVGYAMDGFDLLILGFMLSAISRT